MGDSKTNFWSSKGGGSFVGGGGEGKQNNPGKLVGGKRVLTKGV